MPSTILYQSYYTGGAMYTMSCFPLPAGLSPALSSGSSTDVTSGTNLLFTLLDI